MVSDNHRLEGTLGWALLFAVEYHWPGVPQPDRYAVLPEAM